MQAAENLGMTDIEHALRLWATEVYGALDSPDPQIAKGAADILRQIAWERLGMVEATEG